MFIVMFMICSSEHNHSIIFLLFCYGTSMVIIRLFIMKIYFIGQHYKTEYYFLGHGEYVNF